MVYYNIMAASQVERGISQEPEIKALDELSKEDIARIAEVSGGSLLLSARQGRILGISYQNGDTFLSLEERFGVYSNPKLGTRGRYFRVATPAVLFRDTSVVFVSPQDYYYGGPVVNRIITLSDGDALVEDIPVNESSQLDSDTLAATQVAEEYAVAVHERAVRNSHRLHIRHRR